MLVTMRLSRFPGVRLAAPVLLFLLVGGLLAGRACAQPSAVTITPAVVVAGSPVLIHVEAPAAAKINGEWMGHTLGPSLPAVFRIFTIRRPAVACRWFSSMDLWPWQATLGTICSGSSSGRGLLPGGPTLAMESLKALSTEDAKRSRASLPCATMKRRKDWG